MILKVSLSLSLSLYLTFNMDDEMEAEENEIAREQQSLLLEVGKVCRWKSGISKSMEWPRTHCVHTANVGATPFPFARNNIEGKFHRKMSFHEFRIKISLSFSLSQERSNLIVSPIDS